MWVDQYRTGSGSDRVGLAINNISMSWVAENASLQCGELNTSQTRSHPPPHAGCPRGDPGPLPVLYSSTHEKSSGTTTPSGRISIAGIVLVQKF